MGKVKSRFEVLSENWNGLFDLEPTEPKQVIRKSDIAPKLRLILEDIQKGIVDPFLKHHFLSQAYIAGGCIRSLFTDSSVNDIDIYFKDPVYALLWWTIPRMTIAASSPSGGRNQNHIFTNSSILRYTDKGIYSSQFILSTQTALDHKWKGNFGYEYKVQMICKISGQPDEVVGNFDFTNSMTYYDYKSDTLVFPKTTEEAITNRTLIFNKHSLRPMASLKRLEKFKALDYTIDGDNMIALMRAATGYLEHVRDTGTKEELEQAIKELGYDYE